MIRHRWVRAIWPTDLRSIARSLSAMPYSDDADSGFLLDLTRSNMIVGRFIERINTQNTIISPLGQKSIYEFSEYKIYNFVLRGDLRTIELIDAPRSPVSLFSALSAACNDRLVIDSISIDPILWSKKVIETFDRKGIISTIQVARIAIGRTGKGKAVITSRENALHDARLLLKFQDYIVEKIKIEFEGKRSLSAIFSNTTSVSINGEDHPKLSGCIQKELELILNNE